MAMEKIWRVRSRDHAAEKFLAEAIGVSPLVAGILLQLGITEPAAARQFLSPETEQAYHDPFLLMDMDKAVMRIERALKKNERMIVYGDYDVDGITATTLLLRALRRLGANVGYYIPLRQNGYGLHIDALSRFVAEEISLVISVDCGISAIGEVTEIAGKLDVIVTDHHLPGDALPPAVAVINPHRKDDGYPYEDLAGVGVAFKLCQALWQRLRGEAFTEWLELVALGTVVDMVPLLGENRKLVREGIKRFAATEIIGLQELLQVARIEPQAMTAAHLGFVLGPRLNASGRLEAAEKGVALLLTEDRSEALALAQELNEVNLARKEVEYDILQQAEEQLATIDTEKARVLVVAGEGWHQGVIGLVASRLTEKYYRPSVVLSFHEGIGKGSCRSIPGYSMFEALTYCKDSLIQFGGHAMAAGLSVAAGKVEVLKRQMEAFADAHLGSDDYLPILEAVAEIDPAELTLEVIEEISQLEPFGRENPMPLFLSRNVGATSCRLLGKEQNHLSFEIGDVRAVGWRMGEELTTVQDGSFDMIYSVEINEWREKRSPQCNLRAVRESAERRVFPTREILGRVYLLLRELEQSGRLMILEEKELARWCGISWYTLSCCLKIFSELCLIHRSDSGWRVPPPPRQKLSLVDSETFAKGTQGRETMSNCCQ